MKCPRCRAEAPGTFAFCGACGAPLSDHPVVPGDEDGGVTLVGSARTLGPAVTPPPAPLPSDEGGVTLLPTLAGGLDSLVGGGTSPGTRTLAPDDEDPGVTMVPGTQPSAASQGDTGPLVPGQAFGPRYHIIKLLGLGGMGAVYQAWDAELGVIVALKVIRPDAAADDPTAARELERRFKRELLLARQVTHKNVVRIHDLGELNGIKYITMPFLEGEDLATVLKREGRLGVPRTLAIARGILSGLAAAHQAGVVHRDLKPANIMIGADDEPLIMDFGIARSTGDGTTGRKGLTLPSAAGEGVTAGATSAGEIVGTLEYMAPEQARGEAADQRADIYAIGLILYDMLLGRRRHERAESAIAELRTRLETSPPPPRTVDEAVPEAVDRIIAKCLSPRAEDRYQTTAELLAEIEGLDAEGKPLPSQRRLIHVVVAGSLALIVSMFAVNWWLVKSSKPPTEHAPVSVLIADFDDKTKNPLFKGTLENALKAGVERAAFITAYPRGDALQAAGEIKPGSHLNTEMARLVSTREGIKVVLAGSVQQSGTGYTLKVDAIDPNAGKVLASASATADSAERILAAVGSVAVRVRSALGDTAAGRALPADAAESVTASSLKALQIYARAQELADANNYPEALAAYQEAVRLDPRLGRAWAGMGAIYGGLKDEARTKAAYEEALKHVDRMTDREKLRTLGIYYMAVARNNEKAIENYESLVKLYPADDAGHANLGVAYINVGNIPKAIAEVGQALKIYPNQWSTRYNYAMYQMYGGHYDVAMKEGARVMKEAPTLELAVLPVALSKAASGDVAGARELYSRIQQLGPGGLSLGRFGLADLDVFSGQNTEALKLLNDSLATDRKAGDNAAVSRGLVVTAEASLAIGQKARAVDAARQAVALSEHEAVLVPAALVMIEAGRPEDADKVAVKLENILQTQTIAYARLIRAEIAASRERYAEAIDLYRDSIKRRDTWLARFLLGRLYARADHFPEALAELDLCAKRAGEVTDVFFADTPTLRYLPPTFYWLARTQQALGAGDARNLYERFLAIRGNAVPPDPLAIDARKRLATLTH